jgi:hypothetical protein
MPCLLINNILEMLVSGLERVIKPKTTAHDIGEFLHVKFSFLNRICTFDINQYPLNKLMTNKIIIT